MKKTFKYFVLLALVGTHVTFVSKQASAQEADEQLQDFSFEMDGDIPQPLPAVQDEIDAEINVQQLSVDEEIISEAPMPEAPLEVSTSEPINQDNTEIPEARDIPYSGTYYDANSLAGDSLTNNTAPRQVDPRYEPGTSFVVVQKTASKNSQSARIVAAQRAIDLGRYTSALEIYEDLYSNNPKNTHILMGLAVAQQKSGFTESAIATYEELLKIEPDNTDAVVNMLGLLKAQYPSVAYRRLQELWQENPDNAYVAGELGLLIASLGRPDEALRYLGVAASIEPNNASHFYNMAVINDQAGEARSAIELYQKALELDITYGAGRSFERDLVYDRLAELRRL
jgi:tetratricopeptide (TPR) repeat protein